MKQFYRGFIHPGDICFDVGANLGNRTQVFLELGARVIAIEPQESCRRILERRFNRKPNFLLIGAALGQNEGVAELSIANESTISSMSRKWIAAVTASGRFSSYQWPNTVTVPVTTLDAVIAQYGVPSFVKIDVEGFELEVLRGLRQPVGTLSFEFIPEMLVSVEECLRHLSSLGAIECNYSLCESMMLERPQWLNTADLMAALLSLPDTSVFGDVYVRFMHLPRQRGST
jgi:FkbM family methyltransferase